MNKSKVRVVAVGATAMLAACSPVDIVVTWAKTGTTTTVTTRAKAGPDDGRGRDFRTELVCDGHSWWTRPNWINVEGEPDANGYFYSRAQCFEDRAVVGATVARQ